MLGYFNKKLIVDLTAKETSVKPINDKRLKHFVGGSGLAARMLYDHVDTGIAPLSPESSLFIATGPFTGTRIPSTGRHAVVARSPLTGIFGESDVGGRFGTTFKKTGHDVLEIKGRAKKPVYLLITESGAQIKDAQQLWGKDTYDTAEILTEIHGKKAQVATIGIAGEKMVPLASVMHDGSHGRAAGRCGMGCVMGFKQLKAIVVIGNKDVSVAAPEG